MIDSAIGAMEQGLVPDVLTRAGIRKLCKERLASFRMLSPDEQIEQANRYREMLKKSPVADHTDDANKQHYELPPAFFQLVLGKHLKYSSGHWRDVRTNLDESEQDALEETCRRAEIKNGMRILELGCGWGSLTITMARRYPNSVIVAISNSAPQRQFIEERARKEGLANVQVLTRNVAELTSLEKEFAPFDRVVSVEMFEHMKNYEVLLERISRWLTPDGKLFVHIFTHKEFAYPFETEGADNWMGKYFFTGGQMPSHHLLAHFQKHLLLEKDWFWNGMHYSKTSEAWLDNMDKKRREIINIMADVYGPSEAFVWFRRWRIFFMACAELFGYDQGREWGVSHYLFSNRRTAQ